MSDIIVNKVIKGDETYLDLTNDTVSEGTLLKNRTAHNSEGVQIQGTMEGSGGSVTGVKGDSESVYRDGDVNITAENIGTYTTSQINTLLNGKIDVHDTDSLMTNAEHVKLAGIEAEAEKNVIESISLNGEEITPVNKAVDLSVIDKDVDNLANYYKKSEIDTSLNAKQNIILSSTLSIGGQTIGNVEGALSALNESKSDLVNGKVPVNELPVYQPVIGSIQSIGGIVPPSDSGDGDKYLRADGTWAKPSGGGGVSDYDDLTNRPKINGTTLSEDKTGAQLGLQNIVLSSALSIGGQTITEVEPALRALNESGGGHTIVDEEGTELTQRSKLQFKGAVVSDDSENNTTVVDVEFLQHQLTEQTNILGAKNLIPYPYRITTTTAYGVTFTDNGDGTITANGTATEESRYYFETLAVITPGKECILSGCPSGGSGSTYSLRAISRRNGAVEWYTDIGSGRTFTVGTSQDTISVFIQVSKGTTVTNLTFKPMLRLASDPDNTYVPYAMTNRELTEQTVFKRVIASTEDLDNIKETGIYGINITPAHSPEGVNYAMLIVNKGANDAIQQVVCKADAEKGVMYVRSWGGTTPTWRSWYKFTGTVVS